jgi:hypothetical protein
MTGFDDSAAALILHVLAAETDEERRRKTGLEQRASTIATTAATLAASTIALGGLLYSNPAFQFTTSRIVALAAVIVLYSASLGLSLLALSVRNYPNVTVADLRALKVDADDWKGEAFSVADGVFEKYANYLGKVGIKNDLKAAYNRAAIWVEVLGIAATLAAGLLLATNHLQ